MLNCQLLHSLPWGLYLPFCTQSTIRACRPCDADLLIRAHRLAQRVAMYCCFKSNIFLTSAAPQIIYVIAALQVAEPQVTLCYTFVPSVHLGFLPLYRSPCPPAPGEEMTEHFDSSGAFVCFRGFTYSVNAPLHSHGFLWCTHLCYKCRQSWIVHSCVPEINRADLAFCFVSLYFNSNTSLNSVFILFSCQ